MNSKTTPQELKFVGEIVNKVASRLEPKREHYYSLKKHLNPEKGHFFLP